MHRDPWLFDPFDVFICLPNCSGKINRRELRVIASPVSSSQKNSQTWLLLMWLINESGIKPLASSNVMADLAGAEGELPGSLLHISQDRDNGNRSEKPAAALRRCVWSGSSSYPHWALLVCILTSKLQGLDYTWDAKQVQLTMCWERNFMRCAWISVIARSFYGYCLLLTVCSWIVAHGFFTKGIIASCSSVNFSRTTKWTWW